MLEMLEIENATKEIKLHREHRWEDSVSLKYDR